MGGLQSNGSTGEHAVYYADASTELMFHISTRFNHEENMNVKGNLPFIIQCGTPKILQKRLKEDCQSWIDLFTDGQN